MKTIPIAKSKNNQHHLVFENTDTVVYKQEGLSRKRIRLTNTVFPLYLTLLLSTDAKFHLDFVPLAEVPGYEDRKDDLIVLRAPDESVFCAYICEELDEYSINKLSEYFGNDCYAFAANRSLLVGDEHKLFVEPDNN